MQMASPKPLPSSGLRLHWLPRRAAEDCEFGWQVGSRLDEIDAVADAGGKWIRIQFGWESVEKPDGSLQLLPQFIAQLERCAVRGLKAFIVAAYGPPRWKVATLTVAKDVPTTSRRIPTVEDASDIRPLTDFAKVTGNGPQITPRWSYYGSVVAGADAGGLDMGARVVPSELSGFPFEDPLVQPYLPQVIAQYPIALKAGDKIDVQRLLYEPLKSNDPEAPSAKAFARYAQFIAQEMARYGVKGYVNLWNEDVWAHDKWNHGGLHFDPPVTPPDVGGVARMAALHKACIKAPPPDGVRYCSGATDKSGASSVIWTSTPPSAAELDEIRASILAEGIHPYGQNPESQAWHAGYYSQPKGPAYQVLNPTQDGTGNFKNMAGLHDRYGLKTCATEQGGYIADDERHATYFVRRLLSQWGGGVMENTVYHLTEKNWGAMVKGGTKAAPILEPRMTYGVAQRLSALLRECGAGQGADGMVPWPVGLPDAPYPFCALPVCGDDGGLLFVWQRTFIDPAHNEWAKISTTPVPVSLFVPGGLQVSRCINLVTGEEVSFSLEGQKLGILVSDQPVVVLTR